MGNNQNQCFNCIPSSTFPNKQSTIIQVQNTNIHINGTLNFQKQSTFKKLQIASSQLCIKSGIGLTYNPIIMRLLAYRQQNIFKAFSSLQFLENRIEFIVKIGQINLDQMDSLYENFILNQDKKKYLEKFCYNNNNNNNNKNDNNKQDCLQVCKGFQIDKMKIQQKYDLMNKGYQLLQDKKVAIIFMCAGSSSRFYFQDKFIHKLELLGDIQLLALLLNKLRSNLQVKNNKQKVNQTIIFIGNEENIHKIQGYIKQNHFFYFNREHVYFTQIPSQPILNQNGKICLNFQYNYLRRPKGSACYIQTILSTQAYNILKNENIQYLHFVGTQNLAQNPGDPLFIGLSHVLKRQVSIKCTDPILQYENFDRIVVSNKYKKLYVLNKYSLQYLSQKNNDQYLWGSKIAMNSMIFTLKSLKQMYQDYSIRLQLAKSYRFSVIKQNYYDFCYRKPLIGQKCYSFQKDIKDYIHCSKAPMVVKVHRNQFIPIITVKNQYSVKSACEKYMNIYRNK